MNADGGMYVQQAEFKLKSISTVLRLKKPDENMEMVRHYSSQLQVWHFTCVILGTIVYFSLISQSSLGDLLRLRVRLSDRLFAIHKLHANYGRVFSEWSALEKTMGDGLQVCKKISFCFHLKFRA